MKVIQNGWSRRAMLMAIGGGALALPGVTLWAQSSGDGAASPDADGEREPLITAIGASSDGKLVAAAGSNRVIAVWEMTTGKLVQTVLWPETQNSVAALAFTDENRTLVAGNGARRRRSKGKALIAYEIETGLQAGVGAAEPDWAGIVCASPKAPVIATAGLGSDRSVRLWSSSGISLERVWPAHESPVLALAMSHDGRRLLSGGGSGRSGKDPSVRLWDLTGRELRKFAGHRQSLQAVAFSLDGRRVVGLSADSIRVWNSDTGAAVGAVELKPDEATIGDYLLSPDGTWFALLIHSDDGKKSTLSMRSAETGKLMKQWTDDRQTMPQLAASPDGQLVMIGGDGGRILVWEAKSKQGLLRQTLTLPSPPLPKP